MCGKDAAGRHRQSIWESLVATGSRSEWPSLCRPVQAMALLWRNLPGKFQEEDAKIPQLDANLLGRNNLHKNLRRQLKSWGHVDELDGMASAPESVCTATDRVCCQCVARHALGSTQLLQQELQRVGRGCEC